MCMAIASIRKISQKGISQSNRWPTKKQHQNHFCKEIVTYWRIKESQEYNENCCWTIEKFSFFHNYFAIIDTADYLADQLFIKHQVRVAFGPEFVCPDAPYRVIMCKCRKRDVDAFLAAIRELPNKMLLCGHPDYLTFCEDLKKKVQTVRDNGGVLTNEADDTAQKAEQESAKGATCQAAR